MKTQTKPAYKNRWFFIFPKPETMSQRTKNGFPKPDTRVIRLADLLAFGGVHGAYLDRHVRQNLSHRLVRAVTWPTRNIPAGTFRPEQPRRNPPDKPPYPAAPLVSPNTAPTVLVRSGPTPSPAHAHTATLIGSVDLSTPFSSRISAAAPLPDGFAAKHDRRVEVKLVP